MYASSSSSGIAIQRCKAIFLPSTRMYRYRSPSSVMIDQGVTAVVLADAMGHRDSRTTERIYIHLFNRRRTHDQVRKAMGSAMKLQ
jgi:integrase